MIGVIFSLGPSERMFPFSDEPVGLRELTGETILERIRRQMHAAGIEETIVVELKRAEDDPRLKELIEENPLVLAVPDNFVMSDDLLGVLQALVESGDERLLVTSAIRTPWSVKLDFEYYFLGIATLEARKLWEYEKILTGSKRALVKQKLLVPPKGFVHVLEPPDLLSALDIALSDIKETRIHPKACVYSDVILDGPVVVEEGAKVYERTKIRGPAYIGKHAIIGNSSLVRRSAINAHATIGFSTEVKHSVIESYASTGRLSYIGDSFLGRRVTIVGGLMTVNYAPGKPKLGAFIRPGKRLHGFTTLEYYSRIARAMNTDAMRMSMDASLMISLFSAPADEA